MTVRCFLAPEQWGEGEVHLSGREAHHLARVVRVSSGESVVCFDGMGREASARVLKVTGQGLLLSVGPSRALPEPSFRITLAVGIPGQGKLDEIVGQATQLGVRRVIPMITERTVVREMGARAARKQERLRRVAVEAIKQSGSGRVPDIQPFSSFDRTLPFFQEYDRVLLASVEGPWESLPAILEKRCLCPLILVGPEGDFSPVEVEQAVRAGARRFSLGPTVLRCETACVAAVSLISYLLRTR